MIGGGYAVCTQSVHTHSPIPYPGLQFPSGGHLFSSASMLLMDSSYSTMNSSMSINPMKVCCDENRVIQSCVQQEWQSAVRG